MARRLSGKTFARAGIVLIAAIGLAWLSVSVSLAYSLRDDDPRAALRWYPIHARAMAEFADLRLQQGRLSPDDVERLTRLAREAVSREPTARAGWRVLATLAALQGEKDREAQLYAVANRLSRRDALVQMWFVNTLLAAGRQQEALHHADVAMTVSIAVQRALLPALRFLTSDGRVLGQLAALLTAGRPWTRAYFLDIAAAPPPAPRMVELFERLPASVVQPHRDLLAGLVTIYANDEPATALRIYRYFKPGERGLIRNGSFSGTNEIAPFDWALSSDGPARAEQAPLRAAADGAVLLVTGRSGFGTAARQRLLLPPGDYLWSAKVGRSSRNSGALTLIIRCGADPSQGAAFETGITPQTETGERAGGGFRMPGGQCANEPQWLEIGVDRAGSSFWIDDLAIVPA